LQCEDLHALTIEQHGIDLPQSVTMPDEVANRWKRRECHPLDPKTSKMDFYDNHVFLLSSASPLARQCVETALHGSEAVQPP
jgi:hypothetical protein